MIPEDDKYLQHKMETAALGDLFPGFDKEAEWMQLSQKLKKNNIKSFSFGWLKVAAVLIVMVCLGGYIWHSADSVNNNNTQSVASALSMVKPVSDTTEQKTSPTVKERKSALAYTRMSRVNARQSISLDNFSSNGLAKTTEPIRNATMCAIEICIYQSIKCNNGKESEIADCRTLEPDQAGQLKYKDPENMNSGCKVKVEEIRIKKVSTGETIVINEPNKTEDVFNCLTGNTSCDMMAGIFEKDCDNEDNPRKVKIDNHYGNVIIQ